METIIDPHAQTAETLLTFTDEAKQALKTVMANHSGKALRIFVSGGGCSGFKYGFSVEEKANDDDFSIDVDGIAVLVDELSYPYLMNSVVSYESSMLSSQFSINNPNATASCGCGKSFAA